MGKQKLNRYSVFYRKNAEGQWRWRITDNETNTYPATSKWFDTRDEMEQDVAAFFGWLYDAMPDDGRYVIVQKITTDGLYQWRIKQQRYVLVKSIKYETETAMLSNLADFGDWLTGRRGTGF